jgi:hypothetical protein
MMIKTVDQLVDVLGGNAATAAIAGVGVSAVSNWRKLGRVPPSLFLLMQNAARERGGAELAEELFQKVPRELRQAAE